MDTKLGIRCIGYLLDGEWVLLGRKKEGIGDGNFIGIGGKPEFDETIEQVLEREMFEEIGVKPVEYKCMGSVKFYFPHKPKWDQEVIPFVCTKWQGDPVETDEIKPEWFKIDSLPLKNMWDDARFWLPSILSGEIVQAEFIYGEDNLVKKHKISVAE